MVSVEVKDFGPIVEGAVEINPLTVFIGPNNSGKSHLATLVYALMQGKPHSQALLTPFPGSHQPLKESSSEGLIHKFIPSLENSDAVWGPMSSIQTQVGADFTFANVPISDLPEDFVQELVIRSEDSLKGLSVRHLQNELPRCFGTEISTLCRGTSNSHNFRLSINNNSPKWNVDALLIGDEMSGRASIAAIKNESITIGDRYEYGLGKFFREHEFNLGFKNIFTLMSAILAQVLGGMLRHFPNNTYYLPAARSGILQSHKQLASAIVRRSAFAGIEPLDVGRLSGVVADFIGGLLTLDTTHHTEELYEIAEFLERKIARGRIYLESAGAPYPDITYETQGQKFKMHRVSSMVSELAPLILYLKHRLAPGDLLIFEEPESHLHPADQRALAHAIVKMVRKGVKVMITTHSDYFLPQLGNFVRLSALPEERARRGYDDEDYLSPEDVGCYLFAWDGEEGGSVVRALEVSAEEGVVEDEFYDVSESLYNEYVDLERAAIKSSTK